MATKARRAHGETQAIINNEIGIDRLCELILEGKSMEDICREFQIHHKSLLEWIAKDKERAAIVKEARAQSARTFEEKAERVISDARDPFELSKAKELAHHYRWRASKIGAKEYGDKVAIGGADDLPPIKTISDEQLTARIKRLQEKLNGTDKG